MAEGGVVIKAAKPRKGDVKMTHGNAVTKAVEHAAPLAEHLEQSHAVLLRPFEEPFVVAAPGPPYWPRLAATPSNG